MDDYDIAYVVGDIHGHLKQLLNIQNKIQEDSNKTPGKKLLIYLGDYIDRGIDSKDCINLLSQISISTKSGGREIAKIVQEKCKIV